ncbi:sensor histidine kinase [Streptomyces sp. NPDC127190]|uniref:sensor histidine kinase n=1 Tax=unclassified Streptomyces TaxID=2593676 RepID=UPI0036419E63
MEGALDTATRTLLAREVHDRIGTGLAVALRRLELLEATATSLAPADRARLVQARDALVDTLSVAREVASALRSLPSAAPAAARSLRQALDGFLVSMAPLRPHVRVQVDGDDGRLGPRLADEVFLVVREALRNVLAHAGARRVTVDVVIGDHDVHASVTDDGTGFDPEAARRAGAANGLHGMEERARALGGVTTITSAPGRGTRITCWIPVEEDRPDDRSDDRAEENRA